MEPERFHTGRNTALLMLAIFGLMLVASWMDWPPQ